MEVECLAACANAPVLQINDNYYEYLDKESIKKIIEKLKNNLKPKHGSQSKRLGSEPVSEKEL